MILLSTFELKKEITITTINQKEYPSSQKSKRRIDRFMIFLRLYAWKKVLCPKLI